MKTRNYIKIFLAVLAIYIIGSVAFNWEEHKQAYREGYEAAAADSDITSDTQ